ncbi:MAG: hypothetical protein U9N83_20555 [Thermodesulfobacteriota bacterium]|nr:hypothetical protein [Thermodesulfobacteriota bacterium]
MLFLLSAMVLVAIPVYGSAQTDGISMDKITRDFSSISGYLVEQAGEEYIIDLDASNGIAPGDVFSISSKDKEIIHPVTGKVIGYLGKVKTLLTVTRTESGYSFARLLSDSKKPERGEVIRRYDKVPALFWDYTGRGRDMFTRLQSAIHHLEWVDYDPSQAVRPAIPSSPAKDLANSLIFILQKDRLEVRGPDFGILHAYGTEPAPAKPAPAKSAPAEQPAETRPVSALKMPELAPEPELMQHSGQTVRYEESFPELQTLATFSRPTIMADFVPTENGKLLAVTDGVQVALYRATDKLERLKKLKLDHPGQILSLGWWQPDAEGPLYLAVNTYYDDRVWGYIFALKENRFTVFQERIPRILGTFDKDTDGKPETLLAQEFDGDEIFGSRKWQGRIAGNQLTWSDPFLDFPRFFNVIGSCLGDLTGNGHPETAFIHNGKLFIYSGQQPLFKSSISVGGSESVLVYDLATASRQTTMANSVVFEIRPQVRDVDGDGRNELIVVSMNRGFLGKVSPGIGVGGQSGLSVFKHKQNRFVNGTLGDQVQGHIQGLDIDSERVMMVVSKSSAIFKHGGKSSLLFFNLQQ